jgi:exopolysaccharide biosynthesis protein
MVRYIPWFAFLASLILLGGCSQELSEDLRVDSIDHPATSSPTVLTIPTESMGDRSDSVIPAVSTTAAASSVIPDSGWTTVGTGLERRVINESELESGAYKTLYLLRIDPAHYRFEIGYRPEDPQSLARWSTDSGALIVANGGFFNDEGEATGLIIADGNVSGTSFEEFGGMLSIVDGRPELRWLTQEPYLPSEELTAALQSFPMLVEPGGKLGVKENDGERARRTVIAQDSESRILLIVAPSATFTLSEISRYLVDSDLNIDRAINLDGGASTGLLLTDPAEGIPAFVELPSVILIYLR